MAPPTRGLGRRGFLTDEEKQNMPEVNRALIRRILSYLLPYRLQFVLVFVTILVSAVLGLLPSIITGRIVDEALVGKNMALLIRLLILAFVTLSASQMISVLESYINAWISQWIIFDMKNQMYDHLQHMPHAFFTSEKQGDIITRSDPGLTVGTITASVSLVNRLYRPVESLLNIHVDFTRSLALFTRIFDYFDMENPIRSPENGAKPDVTDGDIVYDHVAFSYDPEKPLLTDISFTVPAGKMYAIVGPSGSGKSTIVNLIPRLYDVLAGSVKIAGVDVRDFDLKYLRSQIGVVTQDSYLFNGTIRENLLYARENATQEELDAACYIANLKDFISSQPDGYETVVGNRGLKLSGGEKQRLSIARVILKDPKILILDEATSALDSITENAIQEALEALMEGRTSIVIAHRLSTILKADEILVVKDGTIAEQGSHEELLARGETYRELYETQFRKILEIEGEKAGYNRQ